MVYLIFHSCDKTLWLNLKTFSLLCVNIHLVFIVSETPVTTCLAHVRIALLYTGAEVRRYERDNSAFFFVLFSLCLLCIYFKGAYRVLQCVDATLADSTKAIWLHIIS